MSLPQAFLYSKIKKYGERIIILSMPYDAGALSCLKNSSLPRLDFFPYKAFSKIKD
jgi:hypothetical protein